MVWPSPQRDWHWPPPQEIDRGVYRVNTIASDFVEIESPENTYLNLKLIKRFELLTSSILRMTYVFVNTGQERIKVGIWENTRIPYEGLVSWKTGTLFEEDIANLDQNDSLSRLALRSHSAKKKLFIDSEGGWLTYQKGDVSLTKQFQSLMVGEVAPGQMPMEVYFDPKERFAELEVHGPYTEVDPGDSTSFSVVWCLKLTK